MFRPPKRNFLPTPLYSVRFRLLSWNIDGLDNNNTVDRTLAVCSFIKAKLPHAVFLQEVIDTTWGVIVKELSATYDCYSPDTPGAPYYVAILVHKTAVKTTGSLECFDYPSSGMGRQLLQLSIRYAGADILLMTSHLESTKDCSQEREEQLTTVFHRMTEAHAKDSLVSCLFGGDLNLRDFEVRSVGLPADTVDVWEACGRQPRQRNTWDMRENDNLHWPYPGSRPSCRFDRLYLMPAEKAGLRIPPADEEGERFVLVGKVRLSKCGNRFPSDHWGMWAEFEVLFPVVD